jgi:hypothetical protein
MITEHELLCNHRRLRNLSQQIITLRVSTNGLTLESLKWSFTGDTGLLFKKGEKF